MAYDLEEQEQIDALKAWWTKYGNLLTGVLTVVLLAVAGWQGWNWHLRNQSVQAAGYYEALQTAIAAGNKDQVRDASNTLRNQYGATAYAPRGALLASQALLLDGDADQAREQLQWVVDKGGEPALVPVARLRLAGLLLDQQQYDEALKQLATAPPEAFKALYDDRRGDILAAQRRVADARAAWEAALQALEPSNPLRPVVQLKLDTLAAAA